MADGIGCKCGAHSSNECACDVDWTPQELIDARSALAAAQEKIRKMALDALSAEGQLDEQVEELTADLARVTKERDEALADAVRLRAAIDNIAAVWDDPHSSLVAELRAIQDAQAISAIERHMEGE